MTSFNVLNGTSNFNVDEVEAIKFFAEMPPDSVDLVFGSPPYAGKWRRYGADSNKLDLQGWIDWMFDVTSAASRVCKGDVVWVINGDVEGGRYRPSVEGLMWKWYSNGGVCERPCIWHKNAPPNRKDWFGNNWEYVVCFKKNTKPHPYFNWEAVAEPPKFKAGGRFCQRGTDGKRRVGNEYPQNKLARPRDVVRVTVGGGQMGSKLASENEAPFPEKLAEYFVSVLSPQDGVVCDPFSGSGTTAKVSLNLGRRFVGCDLRRTQVLLTRRRVTEEVSLLAQYQGQRIL